MDEQTLKAIGFNMASSFVDRQLVEGALDRMKQNHQTGYKAAMEDMKGNLGPVQEQIKLLQADSGE